MGEGGERGGVEGKGGVERRSGWSSKLARGDGDDGVSGSELRAVGRSQLLFPHSLSLPLYHFACLNLNLAGLFEILHPTTPSTLGIPTVRGERATPRGVMRVCHRYLGFHFGIPSHTFHSSPSSSEIRGIVHVADYQLCLAVG